MLRPFSVWRAGNGRTVASPGSAHEQRHAEEQHRGPLHRRATGQHCQGRHLPWKHQILVFTWVRRVWAQVLMCEQQPLSEPLLGLLLTGWGVNGTEEFHTLVFRTSQEEAINSLF